MIPRALLTLALAASSAAAAGPRPAPGGFIPLADAGAPVAAPTQNAVLGVFEGESDTLFWYERDARSGLVSKSVADHVAKNPKLGSRSVGDLLRAAGGGWMILRDPATSKQHFAFLDGGVFYLPLADTMKVAGAEVPRTALEPQGDSLLAVYGSPKDGGVGMRRLSATKEGTESTVAVLSYSGGSLTEAVVADKGALSALLQDPSLAEAAKSMTKEEDGASARARIEGFLSEGAGRLVTLKINKSGQALFKLREGEKDTAYVYASAGGAQFLPVGQ